MRTLTAPIIDGAALIERFEEGIIRGSHSLDYEYRFSRVRQALIEHYRDMMPALALRADVLRIAPPNLEVRSLRKVWVMFFKEIAELHSIPTPPENFEFSIWAAWIRSEAGL